MHFFCNLYCQEHLLYLQGWYCSITMLLIFSPIAKACEPPAGIARLAAALRSRNIPCRLLDANLEAQLWLMGQPPLHHDTWTRRAAKNLSTNLAAIREIKTYRSADRYARAVRDLNRLLSASRPEGMASIGLADYQEPNLSPVRSRDLIHAAEHPEQSSFYPWFSKRLAGLIEEDIPSATGAPDGRPMAGFSLNYLSQALPTFAMIGFLKAHYPKIRIVLGGGLVTSWLRRPGWSNPFGSLVDEMIAGAGELPLLKLSGVEAGQLDPLLPDYSALPLFDYLAPGLILPYSAAGGCWWNRCSFCPERAEGNHYAPVPVKQVVSDLHALVALHGPRLIHILDNAITPALLQAMVANPPGVPWYGFARFTPELANLEFCMALKRSGCVMLKLGLESGDQEVLDKLQKGIRLEIASQVLQNLKMAAIGVYLYLLFGTPAENRAGADKTLEFVVNHRESISCLNLAIFNMPIFGDEAGKFGTETFYEGDLSLYTAFQHPQGWGRKEVRNFLNNEFKRHPAVAEILRRDPPIFTSNHAPLFHV